MTDYILPVGLVLLTVMSSIASVGWDVLEMRSRETWWWACMLGLVAWCMPNPWAGALAGLIALGTFRIGKAWFILHTLLYPVLAVSAAYAVLSGYMQPWMVPPVLWAFVVVGTFLGTWALVSWRHKGKTYQLHVPYGWWGWWGLYDYGGVCRDTLCGQLNRMHLSAMVALSVSAAIGLWWIGQWWALCVVPVMVVPLMMGDWEYNRKHPDQAILSFLVIALGLMTLNFPYAGLVCTAVIGAVLFYLARPWDPKPNYWDSGRFAYWKDALLLVWWPQGWKRRLFGFGTGTWFVATVQMGNERKHPRVFTAAHCEYVQQLLEHGIIGLVVMLGYLGDALWRASQGGPIGQAVFLLGLTWCAIALVNFPATFIHEYHPAQSEREEWFGSPSLCALTFVIACLMEAF